MDISGKSHSTEKAKANSNRLGKHGRSETSLLPKSIRCDKNSPCSSCQIAKLPCGTTTVGRTESQPSATPDTNPQRQDLGLIQESVLEIKKRLERLEQSQQTPKHSFEVCVVTAERNAASAPCTTFQNEPSFQQQSTQASLSAEISAEEAKTGDSDQEIQYSLASLKSLLQGHNLPSSLNDLYFPCSTPRAPVEDIELPPMSLVVAALRKATVKLPPVILHNGFRDHMMLENLCKKVYFPARPSSKGEVTLMNGLLFYLLDAYSQEDQADLSSSDCATYAKLCEKNFCDGIQDYECLVTPTLENIQCLMMGAMKAQGDARPSLCWTLVSTGARLCQSLGYHRESEVARGPPDLADAKRHVFWMLYMIDKIMSLNLGRASSFPDYDIDVEVFSPNPNPSFWAWDKVLMAFIELCKLQGQMYDELYSARARRQPPEMRSRLIQERSASLFAWHVSLKKVQAHQTELEKQMSDFIRSIHSTHKTKTT
ncbi:putative transcriptional regulatory protein [Lachnellula willkommii]|uniref:Putative transcriptional regulatory protein n=1 Tax=Lachnellula willkommii TaxID=215461 RepID=A0A559MNI2_9HELO|nr:putative transcriptional regulatory protein [Lachnellula willkommii]